MNGDTISVDSIVRNARMTGNVMSSAVLGAKNIEQKDILKEAKVSKGEAMMLYEIFYQDIFQIACAKTIVGALLGGGFHAVPLDKKVETTEEFDFLLREYWPPMIHEALFHCFIFGYLVWVEALNTDETSISSSEQPVFIPRIVHRSLYDVNIITKRDYSRYYEIVQSESFPIEGAGEGNVKLNFFVMPGHEPDSYTGEHRSLCSLVSWDFKNIVGLERTFNRCLQQRARPPIVVEEKEEGGNIKTTTEANSTKVYAETILPHLDYPHQMTALSESKAEFMLENVLEKKLNDESSSINISKRARNDQEEELLLPRKKYLPFFQLNTTEDNIYPLPSGYTLSSKQPEVPEFNVDFIQLQDRYRDKVFSIYELSAPSVFPTLASSSGNSTTIKLDDNDLKKMNQTVRKARDMMLKLLQEIYVKIYQVPKMDVKLKFPLAPNATITQILMAVDQDVISWDYAKDLIIQILGLPDDAKFDGENIHNRPRVGGNENTITNMINARIKNIEADTISKKADATKTKAEAEIVGEPESEVNAELVEGEKELLDKQIELEETKLEAAISKLEMQMKLLREQVKANNATTSNQIKVNKSSESLKRAGGQSSNGSNKKAKH